MSEGNVQIPKEELVAICHLLRSATLEVIQVGAKFAQTSIGDRLASASTTFHEQIDNLEAFAGK